MAINPATTAVPEHLGRLIDELLILPLCKEFNHIHEIRTVRNIEWNGYESLVVSVEILVSVQDPSQHTYFKYYTSPLPDTDGLTTLEVSNNICAVRESVRYWIKRDLIIAEEAAVQAGIKSIVEKLNTNAAFKPTIPLLSEEEAFAPKPPPTRWTALADEMDD